jgi:hypothetical protein
MLTGIRNSTVGRLRSLSEVSYHIKFAQVLEAGK